MSGALLAAVCIFLLAATIQSATGFGFALVSGPALFAVVEPTAAVALVLVLAQVVNLLILFAERRRLHIDWTIVRPALLAAIPGLPIGALIVAVVPGTAMRVGTGVIVSTIVLVRLARRSRPPHPSSTGRGAALIAGLAVGVLTTSTTTSGQPLAIWLTARKMRPEAIRDVVTVIFLTLDVIGIFILVGVAGSDSLANAGWIPVLIPVAALGHFLGRGIFLRLPARAYEPIVLGTALASGLLAITTGITGS